MARFRCLAHLAACAIGASAAAQTCAPAWQPGYSAPGAANANGCACTDNPIYSAIVYDTDGPGPNPPALYIGGMFAFAGGTQVSNVARWTGTGWAQVGPLQGQAIYPSSVRHLIAVNDGSAPYPRLYLVGSFTGGDSLVRRFNPANSQWELVNNANIVGGVPYAAAAFDDGAGSQLYIGSGQGNLFSGANLGVMARFNGTAWSSANFAFGPVFCLRVLDLDGNGPEAPALFAGSQQGVFRLTAGSWVRVGTPGFTGSAVTSLAVFDEDGDLPNTPLLFATGVFSSIGGAAAQNMARWNGAAWSAVGSGLSGMMSTETALTVLDDGAGLSLYVGGSFAMAGGISRPGLAKWTGSAWADSAIGKPGPPGTGPTTGDSTSVTVLAEVPDPSTGSGSVLLAAGRFGSFADVITGNLAVRRSGQWTALGRGLNADIQCLARHDDGAGSGGSLYAGLASGVGPRIARLRSHGWEYIPSSAQGVVLTLASHRFPGEPAPLLYAGGTFTNISGQPIAYLARFDGQQWRTVGEQDWLTASVVTIRALVPPGYTSPVLVAGGTFPTAGNLPLNSIGAFDGTAWHAFGPGMSNLMGGSTVSVRAVEMFDGGAGAPARLIAAGRFDRAGDTDLNNIGAWDGSQWTPLASGFPPGTITAPTVNALAVFDDDADGPNTPRLYAAGNFEIPGSANRHFARWNGAAWESPASAGPNLAVNTLRVHDPDGPGGPARPVLIVAGAFTQIGAATYRGLAAFDGVDWSQVPAGTTAPLTGRGFNPSVNALVSVPASAAGPSRLLVGGRFVSAAGLPSQSIAEFSGCPACPADFDASGVVDPADVARFVQVWLGSLSRPSLDGDFDGNAAVQPADVSLFVTRWFAAVGGGC